MEEFARSVNEFLEFRKYDILKDNGKISRKMAEEKAENEYNKFNKHQKITSDFDKLLLETKKLDNLWIYPIITNNILFKRFEEIRKR